MTDKPSETPRTDQLHRTLIRVSEGPNWIAGKDYVDMSNHARTLERELNQVREENEKLREEVKQLKEHRDGKAGPLIL